MSRRERDKGRKGEAEVRAILERHGFTVRGLEGGGDHVAIGYGVVIHSEVKRCETLRLPLWTRQARREAPAGSIPVVAFRRNREPWQAVTPEHGAATYLVGAGMRRGAHYSVCGLNDAVWARLPLARLLDAFRYSADRSAPQEALQ